MDFPEVTLEVDRFTLDFSVFLFSVFLPYFQLFSTYFGTDLTHGEISLYLAIKPRARKGYPPERSDIRAKAAPVSAPSWLARTPDSS
jgi:hypothetical protein